MSILAIHNINVSYGETAVLRDFNLTVERGAIYCLLGKSGCGKSTLLKTLCGILKSDAGEILLNGEPLNPQKHSLGYIPQNYGLLDWLTVEKNLFLAQKIRHQKESDNAAHIIDCLEIGALLKRYPRELSGGQQQRVALARAWLLQPDLLLMDEPFSSLDTFTAERSRELFLQLWRERKTTALFVTHNIREAVSVGKYIVLMPKTLSEQPEIWENPLFNAGANRREEDFFRIEQKIRKKL
ncbi:MAG: ATP-binding cassette domain-containing protein [Prevotellaceae bacterium]|jgi:NitT/TauT family transport system ATP-binding protein|nr:ATP-binding cassette domain-containing protein [Prevotellaceae bacterium]